MKRRGAKVPAVRVARYLSRDADKGSAAPGAFQYSGRLNQQGVHGMLYVCPCGCGALGHLLFRTTDDAQHPSWLWDGNEDAPTLQPSIDRNPRLGGCGWHGYLRAGVWVPA